jgi:hypothetical protein
MIFDGFFDGHLFETHNAKLPKSGFVECTNTCEISSHTHTHTHTGSASPYSRDAQLWMSPE